MRNTVDVQRFARTGFVVVIVPKVSVGAVNALALLLAGNVILMFVEIVGSVVVMVRLGFLHKEVIVMNAGT